MFLAILLPLAVFLVLCRILLHRGDSTREALLRAAVVFVTILIAITEFLSLPHLIARTPLIGVWATVLVLLLLAAIKTLKSLPANIDQAHRQAIHLPSNAALIDIALGSLIAFVLAIIGTVALIAPPNTSDAMEYHLPRVLLWVSNHTVRNFPTADYAQLIQAPAAEFIYLHTYLLFGSDRLFNLVEFCALIGCTIAASLIASRFGAHRTAQLLAALFVVTIPEAVLESSGSMTTVVVAFWIATACYFTLRAVKDQTLVDVVTASLACGLAVFTKGTALIFLPFVITGCVFFRPAPRHTWMLKRIPLVILIALAVNTGQFIRAYQVTGTPLGAPFRQVVRAFTSATTTSLPPQSPPASSATQRSTWSHPPTSSTPTSNPLPVASSASPATIPMTQQPYGLAILSPSATRHGLRRKPATRSTLRS